LEAKLSGHFLADALAVIDKVIGAEFPFPKLIKVSCLTGRVQFRATNLESSPLYGQISIHIAVLRRPAKG